MPTDYHSYYSRPIEIRLCGNTYYVEHLDRSFEHSSYNKTAKECIHIDAWKSLSDSEFRNRSSFASIKKVIFNDPVTVVLWNDGSKTIVKRAEGDKNDPKIALTYAIAKKKFGNNSRIHKEIDPFVSSNAQRIAILKYIVAKDGFDVDKIFEQFKN